MKPKVQTIVHRLVRSCALATSLALLMAVSYAQSSVEKSETAQQKQKQEDELALARAAVAKPNEKREEPETGRIIGGYSVQSSMELGYRFESTRGYRNSFLSQVNVRDGFRVLEYSLDSRAVDGSGMLYDSLRSDVTNAGGDQSQYFSLRMDKARVYRFDANVRRFNYFRTPGPDFARDIRNSDVRQQVSDYNLKLFPQRAVRLNFGYARSAAKGRDNPDASFQRDLFQLLGHPRWQANDYRTGIDATWRKWNFNLSGLYRTFKNDPDILSKPFVDPGLNTTDFATLSFLERDIPLRSHSGVVSGSVQGSIGERFHVVVRGLHDDELMRGRWLEQSSGTGLTANVKILSAFFNADSVTKRPSSTLDAAATFDLSKNFSLNDTFRYTSFKIQGDMRTASTTLQQTGTATPTTSVSRTFGDRLTGLTSYSNIADLGMNFGRKFSANLGWRAMHREVDLIGTVTSASSPLFTPGVVLKDEVESVATNAFVGGVRVRPSNRTSFMFDVEHGTANNAFVRINPLDFTRVRLRAQIQATDTLSFDGAFTSVDRTNPTPQVQNESDTRSYTAAVNWEPNSRLWINAGYDYHDLYTTANLRYSLAGVLTTGKLLAYGRISSFFMNTRFSLTKRLDALLVYYYIKDLGAPSVSAGTSDTILALPLRRHNPEARLAYRFNNHVTGNVSYRHYSYNEFNSGVMDYWSNILTLSARFTF